eukprot:TRINITY_DN4417_c0_g1_i2.p1 TRINITY_DN4417_c0_g1~~TRINITY_DN4417_c0_g1_i2.p1  ORF type:complete len:443 (-),score=118.98 TRINITY_DN4417_c0_g1_i2:84-1412(-)
MTDLSNATRSMEDIAGYIELDMTQFQDIDDVISRRKYYEQVFESAIEEVLSECHPSAIVVSSHEHSNGTTGWAARHMSQTAFRQHVSVFQLEDDCSNAEISHLFFPDGLHHPSTIGGKVIVGRERAGPAETIASKIQKKIREVRTHMNDGGESCGGVKREAFVTMVGGPDFVGYASGALILQKTLRAVGSTRPLVAIVQPDIPASAALMLSAAGIKTHSIPRFEVPANVRKTLGVPKWLAGFQKLSVWKLDQYDRLIWLDADTVVLENIDELFDLKLPGKDWVAAAPDWNFCSFHPEKVCSGLMIIAPSSETFKAMMDWCVSRPDDFTFRNGDQVVLNGFFQGRIVRVSTDFMMFTEACSNCQKVGKIPHATAKVMSFTGPKPWEDRWKNTVTTTCPQYKSNLTQIIKESGPVANPFLIPNIDCRAPYYCYWFDLVDGKYHI